MMIKKSPAKKYYPVSLQQEGVYLQSIIEPGNRVWNTSHSWRYKGRLNIGALKKAIGELVHRQASLRTNFRLKEDKIFQFIHEKDSLVIDSFFQMKDLSSYPAGEKEAAAKSIEEKEARRSYDPASGPLIRFKAVRFAEDDHLLIIGKHHIISDVTSRQVLLRELAALYNAYDSGGPHELKPIGIQYYDYAVWQREFLASPYYREQAKYWLDRLSGSLPLLNLPTDFPRGTAARTRVSSCQMVMDNQLTETLRTFGLRNRVSFSSVFLLAFYTLLSKYTSQTDIIIGEMFRGRNADKRNLSSLIGLFANRLALRLDLDAHFTIAELLKEVDKKNREAYSNQDFLFEDLVRTLQPERTAEHAPIYQAAFNLVKVARGEAEFRGLTREEWQGFQLDTSIALQYDLSLFVRDEFKQIILTILYPEDLFKRGTVEKMLTRYIHLLRDMVKHREKKLSGLEIITEEEKQQIIHEFNDTGASFPGDKTIHQLFEEQAEKISDGVALSAISESEDSASVVQVTYRELNNRANRLAYLLKEKGVMPDTIVGIEVERSLEMIIGILGILKAGGAYLPIDPNYPEERKQYMLKDSGTEILLTANTINKSFLGVRTGGAIFQKSPLVAGGNLAYVIYTSGSTGRPKGVMIGHRSLVNRLNWMQKKYPIGPADIILHKTPFTFDVSVWEIFWWAIVGTGVCLLRPGGEKEPRQIVGAIYKNHVTVMHFVPSMLNAFLEYIKESKVNIKMLASLKQVIASGEALTVSQVKSFNELLAGKNGTALANLYGPTEATVDVSFYDCPKEGNIQQIPIGKPIDNIELYIIDKENRLQPISVVGELCISGTGLARGYLNKPELTANKFLTAKTREGTRRINMSYMSYMSHMSYIYKTGDLARWLADGNIEFLGRIDNQVKIRGFRIELGEIETALNTHPGIKESAVLTVAGKSLCAYVVGKDGLDVPQIRDYLSERLPQYMVPSYFVTLEKLPLTASGKIDRRALPVPAADGALETGTAYEAPQNDVQEKMAAVWQEVLGLKKIGINDNFIALGGESIKAIQVASKLSLHGYILDIALMFKHLTIKKLSKFVAKMSTETEIDQTAVEGNINLVPIQAWFSQRDFAEKHHWNLAVMLYREEGYEAELLEKVFQSIFIHHDLLRAVLSRDGKVLINKGTDRENPGVSLEVIDLKSEDDPADKIDGAAKRIQGSIDLYNGPLLKTGLFKTKQGDHLLIVVHHLVIDGISWRILFEDIASGYEQAGRDREIQLPPKTHSFKHWSETLAAYSRSKEILQEYDYWKKLCEHGITPLSPTVKEKRGKLKDYYRYKIELAEEESRMLVNEAHRAYNTGINDLLLSGLSLASRDCFGVEDVMINLEGHGREAIGEGIDVGRTVGWFTALFPVLLEARREDDLSMHIRRTKENLRKIPGKGTGYGILRYLSHLPENDRKILEIEPEIGFNYLGQFDEDLSRGEFKRSPYGTGDAKSPESGQVYIININGMMDSGKLTFIIAADGGAFHKKEIETFGDSFKANLQNTIKHCAAVEETLYTPADFDAAGLSFDELENIQNHFDPGNIIKIYNLSPMQQGMLFHYLFDPEDRAYAVQLVYLLEGDIDAGLFEKSYETLVDMHEVFRTAFVYKDVWQPRQVVLKERKKEFTYHDITGAADRDNAVENIISDEQKRGFDLLKDLLIRFTLIKTGNHTYSLLMTYHHIIMDGWSTNLVLKDFVTVYHQLKQGESPDFMISYPYSRYIQWLEEQDGRAAGGYWRDYLSGFDRVSVIEAYDHDDRKGDDREYKKGDYSIGIDRELNNRLLQTGNRLNVTPNNILQGVWGVVLHRYSGVEDVVFGNVISGRNVQLEGIETITGLFINTVPVRITLNQGQRFDETVLGIRDNLVECQRYGYLPLAEIQACSAVDGQVFGHLYIYENYPVNKETRDPGLIDRVGFRIVGRKSREHTNYHLNIVIIPRDDLLIRFQYNENVYNRALVSRLAGHIDRVIEQIAFKPDRLISDIELITKEEKRQLLYEFNDTRADYPKDKTIYRLFEEQTARTPDNAAVVGKGVPFGQSFNAFGGMHLSYKELNNQSNGLAYLLKEKGVMSDSIVGIMLERSLEMIIGIFGIVKAGGAYLPIDPGYPEERKQYMLKDSGTEILLTANTINKSFLGVQGAIFQKSPLAAGGNLAYVIYTSGSTGRPKGVMIGHRSLVNRLNWMQKKYPIGPGDIILHKTPFTFDVSVWEIFWWAIVGAGACLLGPGGEKDPRQIVDAIYMNHVTVMHFVPSMLNAFLEYIKESNVNIKMLASLKQVIASGEALTVSQVKSFNRLLAGKNGTALANLYGPTEATVDVSFYDCPKEGNTRQIPIGKPIDNIQLSVIDRENHLQPVGVVGELCISGDGLARGYLNNPQLTAKKFLTAKNAKEREGGRRINMSYVSYMSYIYRTGDLTRWLFDGNIEFLGRIDTQVKIRGFRIELGEIESILARYPGIREAVVAAVSDGSGEKALCAYIATGEALTVKELRKHLEKRLPGYMIPPYFVPIDKIPLTANGKLDRKALPAPEQTLESGTTFEAPSDETEEKLALLFQDILKLKQVGIRDNFFALGGHSLKIMALAAGIYKLFGIDLRLKELFGQPTIAGIARLVRKEDEKKRTLDRVLQEIESLSEDQVQALLNKR